MQEIIISKCSATARIVKIGKKKVARQVLVREPEAYVLYTEMDILNKYEFYSVKAKAIENPEKFLFFDRDGENFVFEFDAIEYQVGSLQGLEGGVPEVVGVKFFLNGNIVVKWYIDEWSTDYSSYIFEVI